MERQRFSFRRNRLSRDLFTRAGTRDTPLTTLSHPLDHPWPPQTSR